MWLPLARPLLGTWPAAAASALTGNQTSDALVHRLNPLSYTSQGSSIIFSIHGQKLFTDFVNDVKDYLKDVKEYQVGDDGAFEKLEGWMDTHGNFLGHRCPPPCGPRSAHTAPCYSSF